MQNDELLFMGQNIDNKIYRVSPFQQKIAKKIESQSNFDAWVSMKQAELTKLKNRSPINYTWLDTAGNLHIVKVGAQKVLRDNEVLLKSFMKS